jgi:hypothetical protein
MNDFTSDDSLIRALREIGENDSHMRLAQQQDALMVATERNDQAVAVIWYDIHNNNSTELPAPNRFYKKHGRPLGPRPCFTGQEAYGPEPIFDELAACGPL